MTEAHNSWQLMARSGLARGSYQMLTVLDEYTREALCVAAKSRMGHAEVLEALYPLFLKHGKPKHLRSDNGSEFIARDIQAWLKKVGIKPIQIDIKRHYLRDETTNFPVYVGLCFQFYA
jgi:transposase InsO family protein